MSLVLLIQNDVESALKKVCSILGSLKEECNVLLTTFFPQIWQMIVNGEVSDSVCGGGGGWMCLCVSVHAALNLPVTNQVTLPLIGYHLHLYSDKALYQSHGQGMLYVPTFIHLPMTYA